MKLLIIGTSGFIAKNLIVTLENIIDGKDKTYHLSEEIILYKYSRKMGKEILKDYCKDCDFVFYLAGVNRAKESKEYQEGNVAFLEFLLQELYRKNNFCPIMYASSIQAELDNEYGRSKRAGEILLLKYSQKTDIPVYIYRLTNVFGKWSRPNYNSVIATFCYNIARNLPIYIDSPEKILSLAYIDDVVRELINLLQLDWHIKVKNPLLIKKIYNVSLEEIVNLIKEFKESNNNKEISDMTKNSFSQKLYSTYVSFLPVENLKSSCITNYDERGSFTELFQTEDRGQFSVNITKPGITKGNHWHHSKNEKFIIVNGVALIQMRKIDSTEILNFRVSGEKIEIIQIPPGYTHNIKNIGKENLVTLIWSSENFNPKEPDTFRLDVEKME